MERRENVEALLVAIERQDEGERRTRREEREKKRAAEQPRAERKEPE
jgi:hypothetical protein